MEFQKGDIIEFKRTFYSHFGLCIGNGMILHKDKNGFTSRVKISGIGEIPGKPKLANDCYPKLKRVPTEVTLELGLAQIGDPKYNILFENCEHFVTGIRFDRKMSNQVHRVRAITLLVLGFLLRGHIWKGNGDF